MKTIAYDRMHERIKKEMMDRAEAEKLIANKNNIFVKHRNKLISNQKRSKMDAMRIMSAVITLQKIYRGW
jgi:hypothetical protein